jgi:D-alanyl-D-alanine carboxypeptidase
MDGKEQVKKNSKAKLVTLIIIMVLLVAACCVYLLKVRGSRSEFSDPSEVVLSGTESVRSVADKAVASSDWKLLLVNPWNKIPDGYKVETVGVENGYLIDKRVKKSIAKMLSDCRAAGYSPQIISTFRTHELQQRLYDTTANKADTAFPGTSEHECGLAADIIDSSSAGWADPLIDKQESLPAQKWLMEHCQDYGFILRYPKDKEDITGIIYEPWHYRYVGKKAAAFIRDNNLCL